MAGKLPDKSIDGVGVAIGETVIVDKGATLDLAGHDGELATKTESGWVFDVPWLDPIKDPTDGATAATALSSMFAQLRARGWLKE